MSLSQKRVEVGNCTDHLQVPDMVSVSVSVNIRTRATDTDIVTDTADRSVGIYLVFATPTSIDIVECSHEVTEAEDRSAPCSGHSADVLWCNRRSATVILLPSTSCSPQQRQRMLQRAHARYQRPRTHLHCARGTVQTCLDGMGGWPHHSGVHLPCVHHSNVN